MNLASIPRERKLLSCRALEELDDQLESNDADLASDEIKSESLARSPTRVVMIMILVLSIVITLDHHAYPT